MGKFSRFVSSRYHQYVRVWRLLKKPTYSEFKTISKVSAVGLIVIGAAGFAINVAMSFFI
ncbi:MAG: protein translocase SEC61 complex subunit gamma [Candidatus Pacearchaeota archaeon]